MGCKIQAIRPAAAFSVEPEIAAGFPEGMKRTPTGNASWGVLDKPTRRKLVIGSRCGFRKPIRERHLNVYGVLLGLIFRGKSEA
jgi:hypothetical protein